MYFVALNFYSNKTDKVSEEIDSEAKKNQIFWNGYTYNAADKTYTMEIKFWHPLDFCETFYLIYPF